MSVGKRQPSIQLILGGGGSGPLDHTRNEPLEIQRMAYVPIAFGTLDEVEMSGNTQFNINMFEQLARTQQGPAIELIWGLQAPASDWGSAVQVTPAQGSIVTVPDWTLPLGYRP